MDKYTGAQLSTDITKQNIVPFTESVNEVSLTVHGTHYMHWPLPLIVAYSITTHKSQSMSAICCHIKSHRLRQGCIIITNTNRSFYHR